MSPTRRNFVNRLLGTSLGALAAALMAPVVTFLRPQPAGAASSGVVLDPGGAALDAAGVAEGTARLGLLDGEKVVVIHLGSSYRVLSATCTHLGCLVHYDGASAQLVCPCHGGRYDTDGRVLGGPPPRPLQAIAVRVEDDALHRVPGEA